MTTTEPAPDDQKRFVTDDNGFVQIQHEGIDGRPFVHPDAFAEHHELNGWSRVEREPVTAEITTKPTRTTRQTGGEKQES